MPLRTPAFPHGLAINDNLYRSVPLPGRGREFAGVCLKYFQERSRSTFSHL